MKDTVNTRVVPVKVKLATGLAGIGSFLVSRRAGVRVTQMLSLSGRRRAGGGHAFGDVLFVFRSHVRTGWVTLKHMRSKPPAF